MKNIQEIIILFLFLMLSYFVNKNISKLIVQNYRKLLRIIILVYIPIGIVVWIFEGYVFNQGMFVNLGLAYLVVCVFYLIINHFLKLQEDKYDININHWSGDLTSSLKLLIYFSNVIFLCYIFMIIARKYNW